MNSRRTFGVATFLLIAFAAAWAIEWGPVRRLAAGRPLPGAMAAHPTIVLWLVAVMYTPCLAALAARALVERGGFADVGFRLGPSRFYLWALLLPLGVALSAALVSVLLGLSRFDPHFTGLMETAHRLRPNRPVRPPPPWLIWTIVPIQTMTVGVAVNSLATFGEEFGWRGYLQVRLMRLGPLPAMLLTGVIWGLWHAPVIYQGYNYPTHPRLGIPLFVLFCTAWAVILGWLRLRSGSLWPAVVGHAAINGPGVLVALVYFRGSHPVLAMFTGAVGITLSAAVAASLALPMLRSGDRAGRPLEANVAVGGSKAVLGPYGSDPPR